VHQSVYCAIDRKFLLAVAVLQCKCIRFFLDLVDTSAFACDSNDGLFCKKEANCSIASSSVYFVAALCRLLKCCCLAVKLIEMKGIKKCLSFFLLLKYNDKNAREERYDMKRIMGIDYGDARTGVAISDLLCTIVGSTTVVRSRNTEKALADIVELARQNDVGQIVVGLPKHMDGTEGGRASLCREFAAMLEKATGLPVAMWDERRTTVEAHNILSQHNYHGKKRKETVDAVAASLILEGYLSFLGR